MIKPPPIVTVGAERCIHIMESGIPLFRETVVYDITDDAYRARHDSYVNGKLVSFSWPPVANSDDIIGFRYQAFKKFKEAETNSWTTSLGAKE